MIISENNYNNYHKIAFCSIYYPYSLVKGINSIRIDSSIIMKVIEKCIYNLLGKLFVCSIGKQFELNNCLRYNCYFLTTIMNIVLKKFIIIVIFSCIYHQICLE